MIAQTIRYQKAQRGRMYLVLASRASCARALIQVETRVALKRRRCRGCRDWSRRWARGAGRGGSGFEANCGPRLRALSPRARQARSRACSRLVLPGIARGTVVEACSAGGRAVRPRRTIRAGVDATVRLILPSGALQARRVARPRVLPSWASRARRSSDRGVVPCAARRAGTSARVSCILAAATFGAAIPGVAVLVLTRQNGKKKTAMMEARIPISTTSRRRASHRAHKGPVCCCPIP